MISMTLDDIKYSIIRRFSRFSMIDGKIDSAAILMAFHNLTFKVNCLLSGEILRMRIGRRFSMELKLWHQSIVSEPYWCQTWLGQLWRVRWCIILLEVHYLTWGALSYMRCIILHEVHYLTWGALSYMRRRDSGTSYQGKMLKDNLLHLEIGGRSYFHILRNFDSTNYLVLSNIRVQIITLPPSCWLGTSWWRWSPV